MVAAVEVAPAIADTIPWTWGSATIAVLLGLIGGGFVQLTRVERQSLDLIQAAGEWGMCGVGSFVAFNSATHLEYSIPIVWTSSILGGCAGSEFVNRVVQRGRVDDV